MIYCPPIYNTFKDVYDTLPILDIFKRTGNTGYIDFIKTDDMKFPIMKGVDVYNRPFIAMKVNVFNNKTGENSIIVGTFFQRYSDDLVSWAYGTCYSLNLLYDDSRIRLDEYKNLEKRLKLLLDGKIVYDLNNFSDDCDRVTGDGKFEIRLTDN
jgi:hypothetical protein